MTAFDTEPKKEKTWFDYAKTGVIILMILIIIIVPVSCFIPNSPTLRWILHALEWLQSQPLWLKGTIMVLILAIGIPIGGPVTPLELCSGFIFGFWLGSFFAGLGMSLFFLFLIPSRKLKLIFNFKQLSARLFVSFGENIY